MFIDIVAWERLGEICNQYLKKGMSALVEGRLTIRNYDDKEGVKRKAVEVVASDMQMLDSKKDGAGSSSGGGYGGGSSASRGGSSDDFGDEDPDAIPFLCAPDRVGFLL
jgi:single-strand DNA-binding protein